MTFDRFVGDSGLKVLALARLESSEYSLMLYLLNCAASQLNELITNERELSSLMGLTEKELRHAVTGLKNKSMILVGKCGTAHPQTSRQSIRIAIQQDTKEWALEIEDDIDSHDAIVFPFRRGDTLHLLEPEKSSTSSAATIIKSLPTWKRVLNSFKADKVLSESEITAAERDSKILVETHPIDQVLLMLRHFQERVPTLSLLASSWQHFQELFEEETQKVDLMGARQKHHELDEKFRDAVSETLEQKEDLNLNAEEVSVLEILFRHRHPRRQLFWAYQSRSRYPNLRIFFQENSRHMLQVTSSGAIVKKNHRSKRDQT